MDLQTLKHHIQTKSFDNFYIFTGEEVAIMDIYLNKISSVLNAQIQRLDSLADIYTLTHRNALIRQNTASESKVYLCRDDKDFQTNEKVWEKFENGEFQNDSIVILVYSTIDKRSKMYKRFKDKIVEFQPLDAKMLIKYVLKETQLSEKSASRLVDLCDNNYGRIQLEEDKVRIYSEVVGATQDEALSSLVASGVIHREPKDAIFDFVSAVCKGHVSEAYKLLEDCKVIGEAQLVMLSVLYNTMKQMLQVQSYSGDNIAQGTGLTPFQIKMAKEKLGYYRTGDLVYNLKVIRNAEKSIKSGVLEQEIAIDYVLVNIL